MTYEEVVAYLYSQLPMYHRIGNSAYKANLDNILALSQALGNPHESFRTIHVTGTNGKGSSSHMLAAVLQQAGYKTGLYTSPHLKSFTERIKINGLEIEKAYVQRFVQENLPLFDRVKPSFFEMTVALAFSYFKDQQVDIAVIEVGLGGRLDSTNIITPLVSLITNIGFDHMNLLGSTLEMIAAEKAGIIKPHVPAVISERQPEVEGVFIAKAAAQNAPLYFASDYFEVQPADGSFTVLKEGQDFLTVLTPDLQGSYQRKNMAGVLQVLELLQDHGFRISRQQITQGLGQAAQLTGLKGRWQTVSENPLTICDTGHNEQGLIEVVAQIRKLKARHVHFVFGTVTDKDLDKMLSLLPPDFTYYFCQPDIPRAMPVQGLTAMAAAHHLKGDSYQTVETALRAAQKAAGKKDLVFVGGSTFVVAEVPEL